MSLLSKIPKKILNSKLMKTAVVLSGFALGASGLSSLPVDKTQLTTIIEQAYAGENNFRPLDNFLAQYENCETREQVDNTLDWYINQEVTPGVKKGDTLIVALSVLCFKDGTTEAYTQLGYNTDDKFGMAGKNQFTLTELYNVVKTDGSRAVDTPTFIELLQKCDEAIDIMDYASYKSIEATKYKNIPNPQKGEMPNLLNNSFIKNEQTGITNEVGLLIVDQIFGGMLDGISTSQLRELTKYSPLDSLLNPNGGRGKGNFYLQSSTTSNIIVMMADKDAYGNSVNKIYYDKTKDYLFK